MNIVLWIVAGVFATGFVAGGIAKFVMPYKRYADLLHWPHDFTAGKVWFMGAIEVIGGAGLILPAALDSTAFLVPVAASGMALYMAGAATERIRRDEYPQLAGDLVFLAGMLFLAWGRFGLEQFA